MPTAKTECTELSVAAGLLGLDHLSSSYEAVGPLFEGSLAEDKFERFKQEYIRNEGFYRRFYQVGSRLRRSHAPLSSAATVRWTGPERQAATTSVPMDLFTANVPISVKANSNVVANLSPYNLVESLPSGSAAAAGEANWFVHTSLSRMQAYYHCICNASSSLEHLPDRVSEFEQKASREDRRAVQAAERTMRAEGECQDLYLAMCHNVAEVSARMFNQNLARSLGSPIRNTVLEHIAKWFLRLDAISYVLCGTDRGDDFAVEVPDLTSWKRQWQFGQIAAIADLTSGQSQVRFRVECRERGSSHSHQAEFHAEIRWSHGRFCGNPEGKLYKDFAWSTLPFLPRLT